MKKVKFKKAKKAVALLTVGVLTISIFAACGKKAENVTDENGKTIITVGNWPSKEGAEKDNIESRKQMFEAENTDFVVQPDNWSFDLKSFYAKAVGGQLPILFNTNFTEVTQIINAGYGADLTDELKKQGLYDKMNKDVLDIVSKDGKVYAYPYAAYVLGLAYNVDLFEKAGLMNADGTPQQPKDWDELAEFAVKIKNATGVPGFIFPTANNVGGWIFTSVAWSYGAEFMKKDGDKWKATFDSPEAAEALQFIKDLKWKYDVLPVNTFVDYTEQFKTFGTGQGAMIIAAGDMPADVRSYEMNPDSIGMMAIPKGPKGQVTLMGGSVYEVSDKATDKQIEGAIKWIKTAYSPDATEQFKENKEKDINTRIGNNELITVKSMSPWNQESDAIKFDHELRDKLANGNPNHVKLYNDFVANMGDCKLHPEEPVCAQELYGILDNCIQAVLTDKNADCAELLKKANSDFQQNYLDNLDY
ncbi:MAG: extracellular solute-binding protein [Eubacteriales bacterium]|nr:extracellular solute-binding protein [Eubacteriales bacterium]MDY5229959.1 extracellular solute-binding protein [Eubacteriales bacterium]